jgi:hypothetical protein
MHIFQSQQLGNLLSILDNAFDLVNRIWDIQGIKQIQLFL